MVFLPYFCADIGESLFRFLHLLASAGILAPLLLLTPLGFSLLIQTRTLNIFCFNFHMCFQSTNIHLYMQSIICLSKHTQGQAVIINVCLRDVVLQMRTSDTVNEVSCNSSGMQVLVQSLTGSQLNLGTVLAKSFILL